MCSMALTDTFDSKYLDMPVFLSRRTTRLGFTLIVMALSLAISSPSAVAQNQSEKPDSTRVDHSKMDHSKMDHEKMDHGAMSGSDRVSADSADAVNPSGMDHSAMDHGMMDHSMMGPSSGGELAWRMPPMDMSMPMTPGMMRMLPTTSPFLPGDGVDVSSLPMAMPSQVVRMADGDTLQLEAGLVRRTIAGREYVMYGYNNQYPGPLIRVDKGATVVVDFTNRIDQATTIHWHGLRLDNRFDGVPGVTQAAVQTGQHFTYEVYFPDEGVYWYHPHVREDIQQDLGLYGNMLVDPLSTGYYSPVNREEALILDDILVDGGGIFPYGESQPVNVLMGRFGNVMLANGSDNYRMEVRRDDVVRFYLTNVANTRTFNVTFGGARAKVVASDVSRYEHEVWVQSVPIAPAERYIVEVQFDKPGDIAITNSIQAIDHFRGEFYPHVDTLAMVSVSSTAASPDLTESFSKLREYPAVTEDVERFRKYFDRPPDHRLELTLNHRNLPIETVRMMEIDTLYVPPMEWNDAMPMMNWQSSGNEVTWILRDLDTGSENMDIHWSFRKGEVTKIRIFNDPKSFHPMHHPIHVHGQRYLVLSIDGVPNENLVWKDTAIVPVGSTMDLLVDMTNPGEWMMHCHIAEHLQAGMMLSFSVSDTGVSDHDSQ